MKIRLIFLCVMVISFMLSPDVILADGSVMLNKLDVEYGDEGRAGKNRLTRISGSIYGKIFNKNYLQLGLGRVYFEDVEMNELTSYFIHRNDRSMLAFGYKRQELDVFKSNHAIAQYQYYQDDLLTIVSTLGYEDKNINDNLTYGSLYLRLYPYNNLMVQTGPRFNDSFKGDFGSEDIELDLYLEWRPGIEMLSRFSFYYEENIFDYNVVGVRFRFEKEPLIKTHRTGGILGI